ncbi:MAG: PocR ligand-binding domain-containing protein [Bacteroidota bacterium]
MRKKGSKGDGGVSTLSPELRFEEIFNLDEVQQMQDVFSFSTGVSSVIVTPDGRPVTKPSNFCRLCDQLIRTKVPFANCYGSVPDSGDPDRAGQISICPISCLMDSSASIIIEGSHLATWFIGQVRPETTDIQALRESARKLGIDEEEFILAFKEIPAMSEERFRQITSLHYLLIRQFTEQARLRMMISRESPEMEKLDNYGAANFYDIFQSVVEGLAYTTLTGRVLAVNSNVENILGLPKEMLVGKNILSLAGSLLKGEQVKKVVPYLKGLIEGKNINALTIEYRDKILELTTRISLKTRRITGSIMDVTERIRSEEMIRQSEERFRKAFETSPDSININRLSDGLYVSVNRGFEELTGYRAEDVVGKTSIDINIWADPEERKMLVKGLREKGMVVNQESKFRMSNGEVLKGLISASIIELEGQPHIISVARNIHDRYLMEEDLRRAKEKAEESDRLKSAFLANMSHEIRTPMNGILDFADLLKNQEISGEKQQQYISIIEKSGLRMLNIINDLIDISRIEAGQMEIHLREVSLNELLRDLEGFFRPEAERKGLAIRFNTDPGIDGLTLVTDREKLFAILTNLVKNAIKFTSEGEIAINLSGAEKKVRFTVSDTGPGISEDKLSSIFDRFVQADPLDYGSQQGAGLGLAITKAYVDMLDGEIRVSSKKHAGSVFTVELPAKGANGPEMDENVIVDTGESNLPFSDLHILIVEDEPISDAYLSILLEGAGRLYHATEGNEAIRICRENSQINLVLMDVGLPGMNGLEVTRRIREFNKDIVIIAQTAFSLNGDRERALEAGCTDYLSKPVKREELYVRIRKHLEKVR